MSGVNQRTSFFGIVWFGCFLISIFVMVLWSTDIIVRRLQHYPEQEAVCRDIHKGIAFALQAHKTQFRIRVNSDFPEDSTRWSSYKADLSSRGFRVRELRPPGLEGRVLIEWDYLED